MRLVRSADEVGAAVNLAKANAPAYCVNFFPAPNKLRDWISHGELFCEQTGDSAIFLRRDRGFWHLYFCAASPASLQQAVTSLRPLSVQSAVVDLVGHDPGIDDLVRLFESAGFRRYKDLFRMARATPVATSIAANLDSQVVVAGCADSQQIIDLLLSSFDCRAEQIPMLYEIQAAIEAGEILVARCAGALAGLLYFETHGLTSTLRYWLVAPEYRARRFGSQLIRRYFASHPAVRRFVLWVISDNDDAIRRYRSYGFAPDGLVDHVLANEAAPA